MSAIWQNDGTRWHLLTPTGFPNEATLHDLVADAPHMLPLAGTPRLIVLGREVQLGNGRADLIAIEPTGRIAIIEIKLARNEEARRAIITQVLAYAAILYPTMQTDAKEVRIVIRDPLHQSGLAHVVLRPVNLLYLDTLISGVENVNNKRVRTAIAELLAFGVG